MLTCRSRIRQTAGDRGGSTHPIGQEILEVMAFTLSHAAAAWPFRRTRLDLSALLVGCFVPDLLYFVLLRHAFDPHSWTGMFLFDLPVGLVLLGLFQAFAKQPSLIFLPDGIRRRIKAGRYKFLPLTRLAIIVVSILVGTSTHLLWDSVTHSFYWPYRHWSFLRMMIQIPIVGQMAMYRLLQYVSSAAGLIAVALWIWHWYRSTPPVEHPIPQPFTPKLRLVIMITLPLLAIWGGIHRAHQVIKDIHSLRSEANFMTDAVVIAIAIFGLGLLACGIILDVRHTDRDPG